MAITYLSGERIQGSSEADTPLGDGLKAYYKMDESSGSTFTNDAGDITGNSSIGSAGNLTITGATLAQSGSPTNFGTNTDFDGSSDYARAGVGTEANFNFLHDGSDWSVSFWAKMDATGSNQHIFDNKGAVGEDASGLDIRTMTTARWRVFGTKASGFYCVENTTDNYIPDTTNFHHYVMTWDNSTTTVSFYRDGANKETHSASSGGAAGTAEDRLVVGGTSAPSGTLNGKVCELAMWNTVLTDAQVSRIYNGGDGRVLTLAGVTDEKTTVTDVPVGTRYEETDTRKIFRRKLGVSGSDLKAYWQFDEASTSTQNNDADVVTSNSTLGDNADLTLSGTPTTEVSGTPSGIGNAVTFDGSNDYAVAGSSVSQFNFMWDSTAKFSIGFWMKVNTWAANDMILDAGCHADAQNTGMQINLNGADSTSGRKLAFQITKSNATEVTYNVSAANLVEGTGWNHFVITWDYSLGSANCKFYKNGAITTNSSDQGIDGVGAGGNADAPLNIGRNADSNGQHLDAILAEFFIFDRVLTSTEITALYNSGDGGVLGSSAIDSWVEKGTA